MELALYCFALLQGSLQIYLQDLKAVINKRYLGELEIDILDHQNSIICSSANDGLMERNVESINLHGEIIITLVSMACDMLGPFVLILYAIYLFNSCVCFFYATLLIDILDGEIR